ncbi:MAG: hypothetical protein ACUVUQ_06715 [Thermodesulfovibrionales bacterium]
MILIDTGPIVAIFDKNDNRHNICLDLLETIKVPLITATAVLAEAFYLLSLSWHTQNAPWKFIIQGNLSIYDLDKSLL